MNLTKLLLSVAFVSAAPAVAFADGEEAAPPVVADPVVAPPTADAVIAGVPIEIGQRPFVLPAGKAQVGGSLNILHFSFSQSAGGITVEGSGTGEGLSVNAGYGINDKISAGLSYSLLLNDDNDNTDFSAKGPLDLFGSYDVMKKDKLTVVAGAGFTIAFGQVIPGIPAAAAVGGTDDSTNLSLHLGASVRYEVVPKLSIFTGQPLAGLSMGDQLSIGLNNKQPISLALPVGAGYQITPEVWAYLSTTLANIYFSNGPSNDTGDGTKTATIFGADQVPLTLGGFYSLSNKLDLAATVSFPDLTSDFFLVIVGLGAQARI